MTPREPEADRPTVQSTTWEEVEAVVDDRGYRAGFVEVFLEFRGAVLDDQPLDAKGRPEVVNQTNFAKHFGIAGSTFHRWLTQHGGPEFALEGERAQKAEAAKERQSAKAKKKDKDAAAAAIRRKVPETKEDFADKAAVHRSDVNLWHNDVHALLQWEDGPDKARLVGRYLADLDAEAAALHQAREKLLSWQTGYDASDGAVDAA